MSRSIPFSPEEQALLERYPARGHYYDLQLPHVAIKCRSQLILTDKKSSDLAVPYDAIVVMMNPGNSTPLTRTQQQVHFSKMGNLQAQFVPAEPDRTQTQVMHIMDRFCWTAVVVLNLSDWQEPKSAEFRRKFRQAEQYAGGNAHSIFCRKRQAELSTILQSRRPDAPIICAWGVHQALRSLITQCGDALGRNGVQEWAGWSPDGKEEFNRFYHPWQRSSARRDEWVATIVAQLQNLKIRA